MRKGYLHVSRPLRQIFTDQVALEQLCFMDTDRHGEIIRDSLCSGQFYSNDQ